MLVIQITRAFISAFKFLTPLFETLSCTFNGITNQLFQRFGQLLKPFTITTIPMLNLDQPVDGGRRRRPRREVKRGQGGGEGVEEVGGQGEGSEGAKEGDEGGRWVEVRRFRRWRGKAENEDLGEGPTEEVMEGERQGAKRPVKEEVSE
ncbi:DNA cross-link repair protein 1A, putative [Babesia ovata]|uniref:DNA cross-link repair protein 1A, putative n=1 Tax=Babesia ovata TaxID=189622 RepID=A0A2H6KJ78_9APIC|nr:DNA cross-link repair protein 1A, putative [Babesia ovata]GBE63040.1 DNA cross-link repair protein 1A, putative [Babesia ovata]